MALKVLHGLATTIVYSLHVWRPACEKGCICGNQCASLLTSVGEVLRAYL